MRLLVACETDGLGTALARRAAGSGAEVRLAVAGRVAEPPEGVRLEADPAVALGAGPADVVVVVPRPADAIGPGPLARAILAAAPTAPWRRLVVWGSYRSYAPAHGAPIRPWIEEAALASEGPWSGWAALDRAVAQAPVPEKFLFRAVPIAGPSALGWVTALRDQPLVATARNDVPVQLLHTDDALEILWRSVTGGHAGVYNACGDGLLFVRRVARRLGRLPLPLPRAVAAALLAPGRVVGRPPSLREALGRAYDAVIVDNARLKTHFGYRPRRTAAQALAAALSAPVSAPPPS